MLGNHEALGLGHGILPVLDLGIEKLFHLPAVQTDQVIMVLPLVEFIDRLATFEIAACQDAGLLELGQDPVHGGQADVRALLQKGAEHVLSRHVSLAAFLENLQHFEARQGCLEASAFEFVDGVHSGFSMRARSGCGGVPAATMVDHIATLRPMSESHARRSRSGLILLVCAGLCACSSLSESIKPYRVPVVQGNVVTREQTAVLRPGMSRIQVRDVLGTPLLASVFHANRWDYVFTLRRQGAEPQSRKVTVFFKNDVLERFEADDLPSESEFVATLGTGVRGAKVPVLEASPESLEKFPVPAKAPEAKPLPPLPASYPPLEPAVR
jgi:outer membrane protein assembly factor BamE